MHPDNTQAGEITIPTDPEIELRFANHPAKGNQRERYSALWGEAKKLAYHIKANSPASREQSLALTHLEDAVMCTIAAISRRE